jgi:hypothetical protein
MIGVALFFFLAGSRSEILIRQVASSGRVLEIATASSERLSPPQAIAPGAPPLVSFRFFEGRERHRFNGLNLVIDDAGH